MGPDTEREQSEREAFNAAYDSLTQRERAAFDLLEGFLVALENAGVNFDHFPWSARMAQVEYARKIASR
jgi:hypothetical protein